jgi:hypothetical protein
MCLFSFEHADTPSQRKKKENRITYIVFFCEERFKGLKIWKIPAYPHFGDRASLQLADTAVFSLFSQA